MTTIEQKLFDAMKPALDDIKRLSFRAGIVDENVRVVNALREMAEAVTSEGDAYHRMKLTELALFFEGGGHR